MVRLIALSNGQNQPIIRLGKKWQPCRQLNPETVVAKRAQSLTPRAGTIAYLPCKQPTWKWLCYTGPIAYPKSWYDRLLRPTSGTIYKNNSVAYPKSGTIDYLTQQVGIYKYTTRSPTPRAVRSTTSPNKRHNQQRKLGRLPQERYNRLLHPKSCTITPTTRSPTPRAVQSTTSPHERHNHSNNSVAYLKSDTIDYFAQQAASTNLQLGRLPQE